MNVIRRWITQPNALLRAAAHGPLRVMFPMVTNLEDWDEAMRLVAHCRQLLRERGEEFDPNTPFGVMFGVPSACLTAEEFVEHGCNFFVIETNDLTQYTHAVDRDISIAERYYRPASHGGGGCPGGRDPRDHLRQRGGQSGQHLAISAAGPAELLRQPAKPH